MLTRFKGSMFAVSEALKQHMVAEGFPHAEFGRLSVLLQRFGLPVQPRRGSQWADVRKAMSADKKSVGARPRFVLARKLGGVVTRCEVTEELMGEAWNVCCE